VVAAVAAAAGDGGEGGGGGGGDGSPNHSVRWFGKATWLTGSCLSPPAALYTCDVRNAQKALSLICYLLREFLSLKMENNQEV
jgi:hypothetical protein